MLSSSLSGSPLLKNILDVISKQHESVKLQTRSLLQIFEEDPPTLPSLCLLRQNIGDIHHLTCKISKHIEESKAILHANSGPDKERNEQEKHVRSDEKNNTNEQTNNKSSNLEQSKSVDNQVLNDFVVSEERIEGTVKEEYVLENSKLFDDSYKKVKKINFSGANLTTPKKNSEKDSKSIINGFFESNHFKKNSFVRHSQYDPYQNSGLCDEPIQKFKDAIIFQEETPRIQRNYLRNLSEEIPLNMDHLPTGNSYFFERHRFSSKNLEPRIFPNESNKEKAAPPSANKSNPEKQIQIKNRSKMVRKKIQRGHYRICSLETKQKAVELSKKFSFKEASKMFNTTEKNIKRWMKQGPERKKGAGRKTIDPLMEQRLIKWVNTYIGVEGVFPDCKIIKEKAKEFSNCPNFKASKGWSDKFLKRNQKNFVTPL